MRPNNTPHGMHQEAHHRSTDCLSHEPAPQPENALPHTETPPPQDSPAQGNDIMSLLQTIIRVLQNIDRKISGGTEPSSPVQAAPVQAAAAPPPKPAVSAAQQQLLDTLQPWQALCRSLTADPILVELLLGTEYAAHTEAEQLISLFANAAQWDKIIDLREHIGACCKTEKRPATAAENTLLAQCLAVHNLIWNDRSAQLTDAAAGEAYNPKKHERGTPTGDTVRAVWLAGLRNAGGDTVKKVLVETA